MNLRGQAGWPLALTIALSLTLTFGASTGAAAGSPSASESFIDAGSNAGGRSRPEPGYYSKEAGMEFFAFTDHGEFVVPRYSH